MCQIKFKMKFIQHTKDPISKYITVKWKLRLDWRDIYNI